MDSPRREPWVSVCPMDASPGRGERSVANDASRFLADALRSLSPLPGLRICRTTPAPRAGAGAAARGYHLSSLRDCRIVGRTPACHWSAAGGSASDWLHALGTGRQAASGTCARLEKEKAASQKRLLTPCSPLFLLFRLFQRGTQFISEFRQTQGLGRPFVELVLAWIIDLPLVHLVFLLSEPAQQSARHLR